MTRYARQTILPEIGEAGQDRLTRAHVLVVGAGGLGVPVLQYLAGAGVGRITLVDGDTVAEHNLHRQPLYRMDQIGQSKALAAAAAIAALNPDVQVTPLFQMLDPANAPALVAADLVLDCADTFAASLTLSDACLAHGTPLVTASALARSGYVAACCGGYPSLRAIFPDLPERGATCATAGVMGPVVGAIGALQAQMALSILLELTPSPLGQLISMDTVTWRMGGFRFDDAPEPDQSLPFIARSQIRPSDMIVDLRTEAPPFCDAARHVPPDAIATLIPPKDARVVLACATGLRAHNAGAALQARWPGDITLLALTNQKDIS
ncbi:HesA/MoeB/ThiF family protein [Loktanella sp. SALINAS62]|uniref:HesA/MoeB/ThiF family protein n=1 Tax=Loktanella sp. SALINAS62 TaxID=2706124 RepID=UPI001B8C116C|nr:HesA/MoeB/ThiF family protein [Loktanella sp. SALINAS62]MBS1302252.1 HesA/MoeB/ThiF family protein [Loktanella sp. SALINAS62]